LIVKTSAGVTLRFVQPEKPFEPKLPQNDPTYQKMLKELSAADPLAKHDLTGEIPTGEVRPTFPATVKALHFSLGKEIQFSGRPAPDYLDCRRREGRAEKSRHCFEQIRRRQT
jgi:hypothetical protein